MTDGGREQGGGAALVSDFYGNILPKNVADAADATAIALFLISGRPVGRCCLQRQHDNLKCECEGEEKRDRGRKKERKKERRDERRCRGRGDSSPSACFPRKLCVVFFSTVAVSQKSGYCIRYVGNSLSILGFRCPRPFS